MSIKTEKIREVVLQVLEKEKPTTVSKLVDFTKEEIEVEKSVIYSVIKEMEEVGDIILGSPNYERFIPSSIRKFFFSLNYFAIEFWGIVTITSVFILVALYFPEYGFLQFIRLVMGLLFTLFIPGWVLINLLFPQLYEKIDQFERSMLAFGGSVVVTILFALLLNDIWEISAIPIATVLSLFTVFCLLLSSFIRILISKNILNSFTKNVKNVVLSKTKRAEKSEKE